MNLDEKLVKEAGRSGIPVDEQNKFIYSVNEDIMKIVKSINNNYSYCRSIKYVIKAIYKSFCCKFPGSSHNNFVNIG